MSVEARASGNRVLMEARQAQVKDSVGEEIRIGSMVHYVPRHPDSPEPWTEERWGIVVALTNFTHGIPRVKCIEARVHGAPTHASDGIADEFTADAENVRVMYRAIYEVR